MKLSLAMMGLLGSTSLTGSQRPPRIQSVAPAGDGGSRRLQYPSTSLGGMLDQSAGRFPDAPAITYLGTTCTYGELLDQVNRMAGGFAAMGVRRGDCVMLTLPNCPELIVAFFAAQKLSAQVVNVGPLMGLDDMRHMLRLTAPRLVVALDLQAPELAKANDGRDRYCWLWVSLKAYQGVIKRMGYRWKLLQSRQHLAEQHCQATWSQLMSEAPSRPPTVTPDPDDVAVLQPTGGTTGVPKVARITHRNLLANAVQIAVWLGLQPGQERIVGLLPMFHVYGLQTGLIGPIFAASQILPVTRPRVPELITLVSELEPTVIPLVPALIDALSSRLEQHPDRQFVAATARALVTSGAAPLPGATAHRFERLIGTRVVQGYGLTEASPVTHLNPRHAPRDESIGLLLPDTAARLVDLDQPGQDVKPGQPGELWVSGPQVFHGYHDNPEATRQALHIDSDGTRWLRTGDIATVDDDGYFRIVDRRKDMINRGGFKVIPAKVEAVVRSHAQVDDVSVIGRDDQTRTQRIVAVIVPRSSADNDQGHEALSDALRALCREHLAPYEVPEAFEYVDALPRSALGKVLRRELRAAGSAAGDAGEPHAAADDEHPTRNTGNGGS